MQDGVPPQKSSACAVHLHSHCKHLSYCNSYNALRERQSITVWIIMKIITSIHPVFEVYVGCIKSELLLSVESNQNVESKKQLVVESKVRKCGDHYNASSVRTVLSGASNL